MFNQLTFNIENKFNDIKCVNYFPTETSFIVKNDVSVEIKNVKSHLFQIKNEKWNSFYCLNLEKPKIRDLNIYNKDVLIKDSLKNQIIDDIEVSFKIIDNSNDFLTNKTLEFSTFFINIIDKSKPEKLGKGPDVIDITKLEVKPTYGKYFYLTVSSTDEPFTIESIDNPPYGINISNDNKSIEGIISFKEKRTMLIHMSYNRDISITFIPQIFERII